MGLDLTLYDLSGEIEKNAMDSASTMHTTITENRTWNAHTTERMISP